jgi:hypothetical protein
MSARKRCTVGDSVRKFVRASDVNIPRVVARVLRVRLYFAWDMAGANDVNILMVVTRVLGVRLRFAWDMAGVSDVNIPRVVTRVR